MAQDPFTSAAEALVVRRQAYRAERCIALDRAVDVAGRGGVVALPGAVLALGREDRADDGVLARIVVSEEVHRQKPFSLDAVVRLEHSDPEAFGLLLAVEPADGAVNGAVQQGFLGNGVRKSD